VVALFQVGREGITEHAGALAGRELPQGVPVGLLWGTRLWRLLLGLLGAAGASSPTQDTVASSLAVWWPIWRGWRWPTTMTAGIGAGPGRWAGCCDHTGWRGLSRMRDARWPGSDARSVTPNVTREQKPSKAAERDLS